MSKWVALSIAALVGLALLLRANAGRLSGFGEAEIVALVATGGLLLFVGLSALSDYRGRMGEAFRDLFAWLAIAVALVVVYAFRDDFTAIAHRVAGEILPPGQVVALGQDNEAGERAVRIRRRGEVAIAARTDVDGTAISMLVDTGASSLVLRSADAEAIGIDLRRLVFNVAVQTANGTAYAAPVRLQAVSIGPIRMQGIEALVAQPGALKESLLGMSFLRRLRSYEFSGDFLTLRS